MKLLGLLVEDHGPDHVGGKQVRRELDPGKAGLKDFGQSPHREGLGQTGNPFEEDVTAGQEPDEEPFDHGGLAHYPAPHLLGNPLKRP